MLQKKKKSVQQENKLNYIEKDDCKFQIGTFFFPAANYGELNVCVI